MSALLLYLLQANVALVLFALVYYALLRPLTFYQLNRAFLVFALLFSALYPLVDVAGLLPGPALPLVLPQTVVGWYTVVPSRGPNAPASFDVAGSLGLVYAGGGAVLLLRLLGQLLALRAMHRRSRPGMVSGQAIRHLAEPVSGFSFWQTIYLNPAQYEPAELALVLRHEQVHVRQWHSLDTLLAQLAVVGYWFNPAVWLLRRALAENLEFIVDQQVLHTGLDSKAYQYSLLRASELAPANSLVNHFHFLPLKTRIAMMNKKPSAPLHLVRYALLVPLTLGLSLAFAGPGPALPAATAPAQTSTGRPENALYYIDGKPATKANADQLNPADIAGVNVLKGESLGKVLGNTTATEAILITTKQHENAPEVVALNRKLNSLVDLGGKLLLIGDQEVTLAEFQQALATQTKQVTSLSAQDAQKRFGARATNGAVLIAGRK
ncbi:M56 family metallopeptidase [Hymenobacter metallicola]|uniref:M56 family peptidase n=1 Tax=Hymenobacter metallicola TaxID=2563114 RepID=A0A4Z0QBK6_9BACT|nr:M56 family metallopeptidase [Hymenobacter metallicola]TGE26759.1 M56 family peptidase [Hymenobacter metallicola]